MALNFQVNENVLTTLSIETAAINDGWQLLPDNSIRHSSTKTTRISKNYINTFVLNTNYSVTFNVINYNSCWVRTIINGVTSTNFMGNGQKEVFFVADSTDQTITFESNGYLDISNITITEIIPNLEVLKYTDKDLFQDRSFTASWDLIQNNWVSYHEYMPYNYFRNNTDFLIYDHDNIKKSGSTEKFLKAILELVTNEFPTQTKVLDSIVTNVETYTIENEKVNDFFDALIVYNETQSSDVIVLNSTNITKKEKDWNFNKLLDIAKGQSNVKLFTEDWDNIKNNYYIDKVVNPSAIDNDKPWFKRGRFRDKYFIIRFFYDNLQNRKIICNFVTTQYKASQR